ncbi:LysR substrate-binding domain-containing protein, partial [Streptomyces sp. P5_D11]
SNRTWRLADLGAKHMLLREGIGWGNMPAPMVQEDLESGRLVQLNIPEYKSGIYSFDVIYRTDLPPGPAARWLIERFVQQCSAQETSP